MAEAVIVTPVTIMIIIYTIVGIQRLVFVYSPSAMIWRSLTVPLCDRQNRNYNYPYCYDDEAYGLTPLGSGLSRIQIFCV